MDALDFSDLRVVLESCTLKRSPEVSHTAGLMTVRARITHARGVVMTLEPDAPGHDAQAGWSPGPRQPA